MHTPAATTPNTDRDPYRDAPLSGCVVAITADRRREEFTALLKRRGARVVTVPTVRIENLDDDTPLYEATLACLTAPVDYVVATTGIGWRGWMSTAEGWGLDEQLRAAFARSVILSRGSKATGAVRACGLRETFSCASEEMREILAWLLDRDLGGARVAVQRHGAIDPDFLGALRAAGAEVIEAPIYRWGPPADPAAVDRLVEQIARREVHAVAFTSAPGATALLDAAESLGRRSPLLAAFGAPTTGPPASQPAVLAACVGEVCATAFADTGVHPVWPERGRLGSLVKVIADELPKRLRHAVETPHGRLTLQGHSVAIGDRILTLAPQQAALLRELVRNHGRVISRPDLLDRVWDRSGDDHVLDVTVGRLRSALGAHGMLVRAVPKRGYRMATVEAP